MRSSYVPSAALTFRRQARRFFFAPSRLHLAKGSVAFATGPEAWPPMERGISP